MSKQKQFIEITPPEWNGMEEAYFVYNHNCPSCNGRGSHKVYKGKESTGETCKRCDGTGKLKAQIKIRWSPDYFDN
jgi:excinuclease UvrABC ATPase subunit